MVLFLFVIMLLDLKEEERRKLNQVAVGAGSVGVAVIAGILIKAMMSAKPASDQLVEGTTKPLGKILFTQYLLPFEILSLLLLVAMVGVILLSKKELK
jgi:NADH-quinone oxidoreductase subunit J